jgi:hypothetical protein
VPGTFAAPVRLEVNHIVPRNGAGYGFGCWNHQDNLETLCHGHHVEVTNAQRVERKAVQRSERHHAALAREGSVQLDMEVDA